MHKETLLFGFNRNCRTFQSPFSAHFLSLYVQAKSKIYFLNSEIEKTISVGVSINMCETINEKSIFPDDPFGILFSAVKFNTFQILNLNSIFNHMVMAYGIFNEPDGD